MRRYLLLYDYGREFFRCEAESPEHAVEQAEAAVGQTFSLHDVFELIHVYDQLRELADPKSAMLIGWLNLTHVEWERIPDSVKPKLWDALQSKRST